MAIDWLQVVKDKEAELSDWQTRLDNDSKLYYYSKNLFTLKNSRNAEVKGARHTTMPDPRIFADKVIASLKGADIRREIEGEKLEDKYASDIERMLADIDNLTTEELVYLGIRGGLQGAWSGQSPIRGAIFTKCWPYVDKKTGKFHPGRIPWDARYCSYEYGRDGLAWAACRMKRTKGQINAEYPDADFTAKSGDVLDIVTTEENIIYIEGKEYVPKGGRLKHKWGFTPAIVEFNDNSAFLRDEGYLEHEGESIFPGVRDLYAVLNEYVTILRSINIRTFLYNYVFETENVGEQLEGDLWDEKTVIPLKKGEELTPQKVEDIKQATIYLLNLIESRLQRGSLPATDYGNLQFTLSAVAIKTLSEAHNAVLIPCLDTIARAKKRLDRMTIDQWVISGFKSEDVTAPDKFILKSKYDINIHLEAISAIENIANWTLADNASRWMTDEDVLAEIVHHPNPQEAVRKKKCQDAIILTSQSPPLQIWDCAKALLEDGKEIEAAFTIGLLGMTLEQLKTNQVDTSQALKPAKRGKGAGVSLPDLFGPGRVAPGAKSSYEEAAEMSQNIGVA